MEEVVSVQKIKLPENPNPPVEIARQIRTRRSSVPFPILQATDLEVRFDPEDRLDQPRSNSSSRQPSRLPSPKEHSRGSATLDAFLLVFLLYF